MLVFETVSAVQDYLSKIRSPEKKIGFVPTMGALHQGHVSLINRSISENECTICSIFINPIQFNDKTDLSNYPRDKEGDISILNATNCNALFYPDVKEIYPEKVPAPIDLGELETELEGAYRPGHFKGVSTVVRRFFEIIQPNKAYFGLKDYQQYLIVKALIDKLSLDIEIIGCETNREKDGLAMSSRNRLLTNKGRQDALIFYHSLKKAKSMFPLNGIEDIISEIEGDFKLSGFILDYFQIVDAQTLKKISNPEKHKTAIACIAGYVDGIRLIDNLIFIP